MIHQASGPVIHGRRGLTYTPLDKAIAIAEEYEDQFRSSHQEQTSTIPIGR
jgi:hypothetical protein